MSLKLEVGAPDGKLGLEALQLSASTGLHRRLFRTETVSRELLLRAEPCHPITSSNRHIAPPNWEILKALTNALSPDQHGSMGLDTNLQAGLEPAAMDSPYCLSVLVFPPCSDLRTWTMWLARDITALRLSTGSEKQLKACWRWPECCDDAARESDIPLS